MRVHFALAGLAVLVCLLSVGLGQEVQTGPAARFQRGQRAAAAPQPQRAGRLVSVEVIIADVTGNAETEMTAEKLAELDKAGKVAALSRLRLSALENQPATAQFSERVPVVTGRTLIPGFRGGFNAEAARAFDPTEMLRRLDANANGMIDPNELESNRSAFFVRGAAERAGLDASAPLPIDKLVSAMQQSRREDDRSQPLRAATQDSVSMESVGTMVSVTARVEDDQSIVMELQAEQTRLVPAAARAEGENADRPAELPRTAKITTQSTLRIEQGKSVVAGSKTTRTEQRTVQTWILVSATADPARPKAADEAATLKIFTLVHAKAESLAELIQIVFRGDDLRVAADTRSNCLIVQGDAETLDMIQRLLTRLDEPAPPASN